MFKKHVPFDLTKESLLMKSLFSVLIAIFISLTTVTFADPIQAVNAATSPTYQSKTTSTISIAPRDNLIIATVITTWDIKASDNLAIDWIAPKGSYCNNSKFTLVQGPNMDHDVSWAYRTVVHTGSNGIMQTCTGRWIARVINTDTGKILTSAGYNVLPNNAAQSTTPTAAPTSDSANVSSMSAQ